jgi:hypothetical protein
MMSNTHWKKVTSVIGAVGYISQHSKGPRESDSDETDDDFSPNRGQHQKKSKFKKEYNENAAPHPSVLPTVNSGPQPHPPQYGAPGSAHQNQASLTPNVSLPI